MRGEGDTATSNPTPPPPPESREIELVHPSYQPSEAELEEDVRIDATPEDLAQAVLRQ